MDLAPYRIPLQPSSILRCADRSACAPLVPKVIPDRRPHVVALLILAALFAGSIPAAFALGSMHETRSRVEIEPLVLEREVKARSAVRATLRAPMAPLDVAARNRATSILADGTDHDAMSLVARARTLADAGVPLTLAFVDVDRQTRDRLRGGEGLPAVTPVRKPGTTTVTALRLEEMPDGSPLRAIGLEAGDAIVSINGYRPTDDVEAFYEHSLDARAGGHAVIEVVRGTARLVLNLWWSGQ